MNTTCSADSSLTATASVDDAASVYANHRFRVVLLGATDTGKTTLIDTLERTAPLPRSHWASLGPVNGRGHTVELAHRDATMRSCKRHDEVALRLLDTMGMECFGALNDTVTHNAAAIVFVYDVRRLRAQRTPSMSESLRATRVRCGYPRWTRRTPRASTRRLPLWPRSSTPTVLALSRRPSRSSGSATHVLCAEHSGR